MEWITKGCFIINEEPYGFGLKLLEIISSRKRNLNTKICVFSVCRRGEVACGWVEPLLNTSAPHGKPRGTMLWVILWEA